MEERYLIEGGTSLQGTVHISGSKNASLPILAASLLTSEKCVISGVPRLADVCNMVRMLQEVGAQVGCQGSQFTVCSRELQISGQLPQFARKMRASFLLLAPLLVRLGSAVLPLPGGCAIGQRPVDLHLKGLQALGARIDCSKGWVEARAGRLQGADITLDFPSVGATENILMAAVGAEGTTIIRNAAREPEIVDLALFLNQMGARVTGAGSEVIRVKGVEHLGGAMHSVIPDRIEAGTYLAAAVAIGGCVRLQRVVPGHMRPVLEAFRSAGVDIEEGDDHILAAAPARLRPVSISTSPHPGFPTDMQPQLAAVLTGAGGTSVITENVFESRYLYIEELWRMGAAIDIQGRSALIHGVSYLKPARVKATDLRAGAALVIAALKTWGETEISGVFHLDRGYENLEEKLTGLGGRIRRLAEQAANL